jgi:hypothetical protein
LQALDEGVERPPFVQETLFRDLADSPREP